MTSPAGGWTRERIVARAGELLSGRRAFLIGGSWQAADDGARLPVSDPSTGDQVGMLPEAGNEVVAAAVDAARAAQPAWQALGAYGRQRVLEQLAAAIEEAADTLAWLDALASGNPLPAMRRDVHKGARQLRYMAGAGLAMGGCSMVHEQERAFSYTVPDPYGVVGRLLPFNHPAAFSVAKIAAPLVAGNTVVLKPPEQAPLSALVLAELYRQVLPAGVVNIVTGGAATGDAIVRHPDVKRIAFTGSADTGRAIQAAAAAVAVKHVSLELGGKNPMLVLPDADLQRAVDGAVSGMNLLVCQGQSCGSSSRVLVHRSMFAAFEERLVEALAAIRVGRAYAEGTDMGPLVSAEQYTRVLGYIELAREEGIRIAHGGGRPDVPDSGGYYLAPTVLSEPPAGSRVAQEEIFGPVIALLPWDQEEEAVAIANGIEYGLTASVWSNDARRAHRIAHQLDAGYVWINEHGPHYIGTPFGGRKGSGIGREESMEEIASFTDTKVIHVAYGP